LVALDCRAVAFRRMRLEAFGWLVGLDWRAVALRRMVFEAFRVR
jgi:hypothetical protein